MSREEPLYVQVENRNDDVPCPVCNEKTRKEDLPHIPMPDLPENAEWLAEALGKAFCENAGCPVCKEQKLVDWSHRTGGVTYRATLIPAAEDGAPFHGPQLSPGERTTTNPTEAPESL
jgi:hypothetical protein